MLDGAKRNQANANGIGSIQSVDSAQRNKGDASKIQPIDAAQRGRIDSGGPAVFVPDLIDTDISDDLISYWKLNEESGTRFDSVGDNDLTDNNTVTFTPGKQQSNAALFTAANTEYLSIDSNPTLVFGDNPITFAFWLYFNTVDNGLDPFIFGKFENNAAREFRLYKRSITDDLSWAVGDGGSGSNAALSADPVVAGTWYFICCGYDKVAGQVWIKVNNGARQNTAHTIGFGANTNPFKMGDSASLDPLDGIIEEFGIYNRLLTADEMTHLYNAGNGRTLA